MIFFYFHVNIFSSIHFPSLIHVEHGLDLRGSKPEALHRNQKKHI